MKSYVPVIITLLATSNALAQGANAPAGSTATPQQPAREVTTPSTASGSPSVAADTANSAATVPTQTAPEPGAVPAPAPDTANAAAPTTPPAALIAPPTTSAADAAADAPRPAAAGPMKIELPNATIKFGFLLQPQYEAIGSPALNGASNNIFVRRARIIVGATFFKNFEFFLDTDYPNLFKATNNTPGELNNKATPGMNVQDAFGTAKIVGDALKIDLGYMLPPLAHNALQGAGTLYSWDYFSNSFRHSNVFQSTADPVGRDTGVQLRGLVLNDIVEYRVGMFQGKREDANTTRVGGRNMFRVAGRLQINLLDPETGFFYAGSYLGTKRVLSFGVSYDFQDGYHHSSGDGILDLPLGPGVLTAQADVSHWNGGTWVGLPRQSAFMSEVGYLIDAVNLSPIFRFERRWVDNQTANVPDETRVGGGLAFWPYGHNFNVKAFYTRIMPKPAVHDYNQAIVQAQFYVF
jgi:hypothetical protein